MRDLASPLVTLGIPGLAALVAVLFVLGARHAYRDESPAVRRTAVLKAAGGVLAVAAITGGLAASQLLYTMRTPPIVAPMQLLVMGVTVFAALSSFGARIATKLPLFALVGAQAFRLPLEFVMRQAARDRVMPVEMSFEGYNFDVLTGATALLLGVILYVRPVPRFVVIVWNVLGALLLANILTIAVAALPWIAAFGPDHVNEWVLFFPFVYLPTLLVPAALFGHIVVARRLIAEGKGTSEPLHGRGTMARAAGSTAR